MVIIKFLEKIFGSKKEAEVPAIELQEWFEGQSEYEMQKADAQISSLFSNFSKKIEDLKKNLSDLEESQLMNPNISPREKHVVEGNRIAYSKKVDYFIDSIEIPDLTYENALSFTEDIKEKLDHLAENSQRSYYILKNYFEDNLNRISSNIKELDSIRKSIKKEVGSKSVKYIMNTINLIKNYNEALYREKQIAEDLKKYGNEILKNQEKEDETTTKIEDLKKSKDYQELIKTEAEKERSNNSIKRIESDIIQIFSPIEKYLKKFLRESDDPDLIKEYLDNSLKALENDVDLRIIPLLTKLKLWLYTQDIKSKDKVIEKIEAISKEKVEKIQQKLIENKEKLKEADSVLRLNTSKLNLKELEYQKDHFELKIKQINREIKSLQKENDSLKLDDMKEKLQSDISDYTGIVLRIILE